MGYRRVGSSWNAVDGSVTGFSFTSENCPTYNKTFAELQSSGFIDSSKVLLPTHDAASQYLGLPWRMPTSADFSALWKNTTYSKVTSGGVSGLRFTGKGDYASKSIFIPIVGYVDGWLDGTSVTNSYVVSASDNYVDYDISLKSNCFPISWCSVLGSSSPRPVVFYYQVFSDNRYNVGTEVGGRSDHVRSFFGLQIRPVISYGN